MTTKELRIGNYVLNGFGNPFQIEGVISEGNTGGYRADTLKPIPLTEDWLLRFGFTKYADGRFYITLGNTNRIFFNLTDDVVCEMTNKDGIHFMYSEVKYVHQLQNLYFALTGMEL